MTIKFTNFYSIFLIHFDHFPNFFEGFIIFEIILWSNEWFIDFFIRFI